MIESYSQLISAHLRRHGLAWSIALAGAGAAIYLIAAARATNGAHGFPLDDPWIHLTYARNLAEFGVFAYFPGDPSSAGSTAPLYTLLLAGALALFSDEKLVSYALGLVAQLGYVLAVFAWASRRLGDRRWAAVAALVVALDGRSLILAASGMETSLFVLLVAVAFYGLSALRTTLVGVALGLALWVRPDALILVAVFGVAALLEPGRSALWHRWRRGLATFAALALSYFLFNLSTGGALLPGTFAGKTAYYRLRSRLLFLEVDVLGTVTANAGWVLGALALLAIVVVAYRLWRRRSAEIAAEVGWIVALPLAYLLFLPFAHRFQRYLMPAWPALVIAGLWALRQALAAVESQLDEGVRGPWRRGVITLALVVGGGGLFWGLGAAPQRFAELCAYHAARHERAGRWLAENTPKGAVVATHDIGAIAFYSRRRVVDVVGLVSPEVVRHIHTAGYTHYLRQLFTEQRVTHVATLRNWLEVDNIRPIFVADSKPEILEVFAWDAQRAHLVSPRLTRDRRLAVGLLSQGKVNGAVKRLQALVREDARSARSWIALGRAQMALRQEQAARTAFARAKALFPDHPRLLRR